MQGDQLFLHVGARAHLLRGAEEYPDLTAAHLSEQLLFLDLGIGSVDIGDFLGRDAFGNELIPDGVIDIEVPVIARCREINKDHLC